MNLVKVFVYGTLKTGMNNHHILKDNGAKSLGPASLETSEFLLCAGRSYPYIVPVNQEQWDQVTGDGRVDPLIVGELFEGPESIMKPLDRLEGYPNHYLRKEMLVNAYDFGGQSFKAWMYHRNGGLRADDYVCVDGFWWPQLRTMQVPQLTVVDSCPI